MDNGVVIIGGSHAAVAVADSLRKRGFDGAVTILSAESELPYQRPPLSKAYMAGDMTLDRLHLRPRQWYEDNAIALHLDHAVYEIDRVNRTVGVRNAKHFSYQNLVIATGARPRNLPADMGGALSNVHTIRDLGDAQALMKIMAPDQRLVVVGGGYIGLEAAAEARKKGLDVTVIEAADRILQRVACKETADYFRALHSRNGVTIMEATGVQSLSADNDRASHVVLADGTSIACDLVIVGIGIVPNSELAHQAGLEIDGGAIVVDAFAQTSDPAIWACGDCTLLPFRNQPTRLESVQNANDQASAVAANIMGDAQPYAPNPWFWSDQYDVSLQIAGLNRGFDTVIKRAGKREGALSHFYFKENSFLAVDCLNDASTYVAAKKILELGKTLTPDMLCDPDFNLKSVLKR